MRLYPSLFIAVLLHLFASRARAWDDFGHMQIAAVAYDQLTDVSKARIAQLLELNPSYANWIVGAKPHERNRAAFLRAATWADAIKFDRGYKRDKIDAPTATQNVGYSDLFVHDFWHYVDLPFSGDGTATAPTPVPNAQTQIALFRSVLSEQAASDELKSYDLAWVLHLVGDVHQPLHCIARFTKDHGVPDGDRGGNEVKITGSRPIPVCNDSRYCPYGPPTNLHAFVDIVTGDSYSIADVTKAVKELPRASKLDAAVSDVTRWIEEGAELAKSHIYTAPIGVGAGPYTVDEKYQNAVLRLARSRISLAGTRLARLLNDAFASEAKAKQVTTAAPPHQPAATSSKAVSGVPREAQASARK